MSSNDFENYTQTSSPVLDQAVGMVFQLADGTLQSCNSAAEEILGFTLAQMQSKTSLDSLWQTVRADGSPFPGDRHPAMVALRTGEPVTGVAMGFYQPTGQLIWINVDAQPLFHGASPTPWAVVATFWPMLAPPQIEPQQTALQSNPSASDGQSQSLPYDLSVKRILLVEDCAEDRAMMRRYLTAHPRTAYQILEAETGKAGLEICRTTQLDLVVLDYGLPDETAVNFLATLRSQFSGNPPPVVVVTGQGSEAIAAELFKAGVTDYLIKGQIQAYSFQAAVDGAIAQAKLSGQLQRSLAKERLVAQIAQQIHRSLNLNEVLHRTVWEILQFLQTDRVLVVRFEPGLEVVQVVGEAVKTPWPALLSSSFYDSCFVERYAQLYRQGRVNAIPDVDVADLEPCYREFLSDLQVRANLIVPILCDDRNDVLWGLLVAHHCAAPRVWQSDEIDLLQQLATQLGIALHRSELYLQTQTELTARRQLEQYLQESQERLQLGIQVAGVALAKFDYATNTVELSPEAAVLFGLPIDNLLVTRDRIHATFHPEERDELMAIIAEVIDPSGSGWFAREHRVVWENGEVRWLSVRKQLFFNRSGDVPFPEYAILAAIDVTEAKQAQMTSQEQLAQIEAIYATAPIGLCFLDREWRFVQMNEQLAEINGLPISEQLGRTVRDVLPELAELQEPIFQQVLETGIPVLDVEVQGKTPAQPDVERYWSVSYYPLKVEDNILGINIMVQEITNRKRTERERSDLLAQAQAAREEAEAANRSKDEFVAVVAHELRSPLNSIAGWAKLLQTRKFDEKTMAKAVDTIWRNTQVQVQLVEDLLDISRMVRGTLQLTLGPVNFTTVVEAAIDLVLPQAQAKAIQIDAQLPLFPPLHGDFSRLQQIVVNLLTNAIKFTPPQGRVDVRLESADDRVQLRIRDTGKGIMPEFLPHLFDRYQQGQKNTGSQDGLGLGLTIVKNLVELHHGTIAAESEGKDKGATFTVQLPLPKTLALQPEPPIADTATSLEGVRLLVVDDEPDMLNLITFVLEEAGAQVQSTISTKSALNCLNQFKPDLLISDIAMPGGTGYDLIQQVRTHPNGQIPAIALTAYASTTYEERSLQAGFQRHLTKPVEPDVLVATIINLINLIET
jgi:PAS domain S-box-containing protein